MNILIFKINLILIISFVLTCPLNAFCDNALTADDLVYLTENFPPHNYIKDGRLVGASVEILEMIWKKLGSLKTKNDIKLIPWARAIKRMKNEPNIVLFGMGFSVDRIKKFHWVGPYYTHSLSLIAKKEEKIKINALEDAKMFLIGVVREDVGHQMLINLHFQASNLDLSSDIDVLFNKLKYDRFNLICYVEPAFFKYMDKHNLNKDLFEPVFQVSDMRSGFGFSKEIPGYLILKFQKALDELKNNKSINKILKKYKME
ncbi:MAG: amino acid ABC transporter substrate-binding protein [Deltaproteobacteria bacterium]|nr:amino acid ABC transporter substrate-binding protein [Deltaproteobacteria bacterium]